MTFIPIIILFLVFVGGTSICHYLKRRDEHSEQQAALVLHRLARDCPLQIDELNNLKKDIDTLAKAGVNLQAHDLAYTDGQFKRVKL